MEYDANLKDSDINRIKQVEKTYSEVSKNIHHRKQWLLGEIPGPSALQSQPAQGHSEYPRHDVPTAPETTSFNEPIVQQAWTPCSIQQPPFQRSQMHQITQQQVRSLPQPQPFVSQDLRNRQDFGNQQDYHNQSDPQSQEYI